MEALICTVVVGVVATGVMDLSALARQRLFGTPLADYGLVGRWLAYMPRGRFRHDSIAASPPIAGESWIGWSAHYLIGISYAAILIVVWGVEWARQPTLLPALIVGIGTIAAPFLLMQPGMGAGVAASRTPNPAAARLRSLAAHASFGVGLYVGGWLYSLSPLAAR